MIYRNIKTGAEIISKSVISAPNYILVEDNTAPKKTAPEEAPKKEPPKEEPKAVKSEPKKAPKKRGCKK